MRNLPDLHKGATVVCIDASNGANFLAVGRVYTVQSLQTDRNGELRLDLVGMNRAWEQERFRPASWLQDATVRVGAK